ncbi:MAG: hypothetical protein ACOZQL_11805 [Myxococcota bacterium]
MIETPPPIEVTPTQPSAPAIIVPVLQYVEPLPLPPRHTVHVSFVPASARRLDELQSVELDVEVEGGAPGTRTLHAVFVSPQGLAWEKQPAVIDARPGVTQRAHFSLPVAATMISDQRLAGSWQVTMLDEGVEQASASFALEE